MITHICDRCGRPLEEGELRYIAKIEVFAAADLLKIDPADLAGDLQERIHRLMEQCEQMSEAELMQDVHVAFRFDLCRRCQRQYIRNPLFVA